MFYGSVPNEVQSIVISTVKEWNKKDIYIGCSGNFTLEKAISPLEKFELHSNDVLLYSNCIGRYLSGQSIDLKLSEEGEETIPFVKDFMDDEEDKLATILLMSSIVRYMGKNHPYYAKMYNEYIKQYKDLHKRTKERIRTNQTHIQSYYNGDVMDYIENAGTDCGFLSFPPFKSAGKAFIKDFERLESLFEWKPPEYKIFDEEGLKGYFRRIMEKDRWLFATDIKLKDEFADYLKAQSKTTNRGISIYIYSNTGEKRFIGPRQDTESLYIPRLTEGDEVGDNIELKILSNTAFQTLRSEYMNINIRPGQATLAIGVLVDEKLVGVYAFSAGPTMATWDTHIDTPTMYLLSDFPVEPVDYDRLAKLVLYAAQKGLCGKE